MQSDLLGRVLGVGRAACLALVMASSSAILGVAQENSLPDYRDDRSTPEAVLKSLYNAVERQEYLRAWSYFADEPDRPDFSTFAKGYEGTEHVRLKLGAAVEEGAAGSLYYSVPAVVEAKGSAGMQVFAGCYQLRLIQPAVQEEPPFRPMSIIKGALEKSDASFDKAEGSCKNP